MGLLGGGLEDFLVKRTLVTPWHSHCSLSVCSYKVFLRWRCHVIWGPSRVLTYALPGFWGGHTLRRLLRPCPQSCSA